MSPKKEILLIEDDIVDAEYVIRVLSSAPLPAAGYAFNVMHTPTLSEGISALKNGHFDLILLDLGLPDAVDTDPFQAVKAEATDIPIVMLTGSNSESLALEVVRSGAQDFLVKGESTKQELIRCITYAIERHILANELAHTASALHEKTAILQSIIDHMGDGVVVTDQTGKLTLFNPAAVEMLDVSWMELPPQKWPSAYGAYDPVILNKIRFGDLPMAAALRGERVDEEELFVKTHRYPEGRYVSVTARAIKNEQSRPTGCVAVMHDITKRRKSELLKDEFVSVVSHELRTPLTSISGSLGLILGNIAGSISQEAREMIEIAHRNSDRLVRLIGDLLDIQKLEAGQITMVHKPVNMAELVGQSVLNNEGYAEKHGVSYAYHPVPGEEFWVEGDADRLLQVMANLLSNAAKFSPDGSQVTIQITSENNTVKTTVTDEGEGIPEAFRDEIFGKFMQADSSNTRKQGGTGLGLNISKSIVNLHNGEIGFETHTGKGTTFYFDLPLLNRH